MPGSLWTLTDLCTFLQIPTATARKWVRLKKIPVVRCGRLLRFRPAAIEVWLSSHESKPSRRGQ